MKASGKPLLYNFQHTAFLLGIGKTKLNEMVRNNEIESHKVFGRRLFVADYIHGLVEKLGKKVESAN